MARQIPYIDTSVSVARSIAEIEEVISAHANDVSLMKRVESGHVREVAFRLDGIDYRLPGRVENIYQLLLNEKLRSPQPATRNRYREDVASQRSLYEQAERCGWRNVMMHVKSTLALVEIGMVTVTEVFMPYRLTDNGETAYERLMSGGFAALMAPKVSA